ncbi:hypothetical protein E2320_012575, partial [Naja naja]
MIRKQLARLQILLLLNNVPLEGEQELRRTWQKLQHLSCSTWIFLRKMGCVSRFCLPQKWMEVSSSPVAQIVGLGTIINGEDLSVCLSVCLSLFLCLSVSHQVSILYHSKDKVENIAEGAPVSRRETDGCITFSEGLKKLL